MTTRFPLVAACAFAACPGILSAQDAPGPRQMERLDRGVLALPNGNGSAFVSWQLLGTDPDAVAFVVDRVTGDLDPVRIAPSPIRGATNLTDPDWDLSVPTTYVVTDVVGV